MYSLPIFFSFLSFFNITWLACNDGDDDGRCSTYANRSLVWCWCISDVQIAICSIFVNSSVLCERERKCVRVYVHVCSVWLCWHRNKRKWLIIYSFDDNLCWHINRLHVKIYVEIALIVAAVGVGWQEKVTHEWAYSVANKRQRAQYTGELKLRVRETIWWHKQV